ncbi:MAG: FadR/GntR family transcriptional regulator [Acetobacteraceae bacterium]
MSVDSSLAGLPKERRGARARPDGNLHQRIARDLGERIAAGQPVPGTQLPTEAELCVRLSVSRSALREGFRLLAGKGLITSKRKVGTVVRPRAKWNMLDPDVLAWHLAAAPTDRFVIDLFEVRRIVEPFAASLAAQRADAGGVALIGAAAAEMFRARENREALLGADLRFHEAMLETTGNPFLVSFGAVIESALRASFQLSWSSRVHTREYSLRRHRQLWEAIRERRAEEAFALMSELLRSAAEDVHDALLKRRLGAKAGSGEAFVLSSPGSMPASAQARAGGKRRTARRNGASLHKEGNP